MPLKNYTTEVPAMKSVGQIQGNLVDHGATDIMVHYSADHEPESLSFLIKTAQGEIPFRLPANVKAVERLLEKQKTRDRNRLGQPSRVAWRIIKNWVDAQLAIIETEMVTIEQVFLPYMQVKNSQTLYEAMVDKRFLLTAGEEK